MKVIEYAGIEFSILEDIRNDITIFSFYEREPDEDGIYRINLKKCSGTNINEQELLNIIKTFNI